MLEKINTILSPLENLIKKYRLEIGYFFIFLSLASFSYFFVDNGVKESGEQALNLLWVILWIPILARVFGIGLFRSILPLRKELGILMGALAFVHGASYIDGDMSYAMSGDFWISDGFLSYLGFGMLALIFTIPLTLTSSNWAMRKMGKYWKHLHRSAYIILILTVIHVVLLKSFLHFEFGPVLIMVAYFIGKGLEWKGISFTKKDATKTYSKGQKWICIPCGFIYDPVLGDEDSGIAPGTEFSDIPDAWNCPLCGVKKGDFVPYNEGTEISSGYDARIVEKTFLNPATLELVIEILDDLTSKPGQFVSFQWEDNQGNFTRSYSIVEQKGNRITFTIKLGEKARGGALLRDISVGANIRISGIYGHFLLTESEDPKVFIATGTGLAPIYSMLLTLPTTTKKSLYFSVAREDELFYEEKLRAIENLDLHIHITREDIDGYESGRVDVDTIDATEGTEWYLCGNPKMVTEATEKLAKRGFEKVFSEEF